MGSEEFRQLSTKCWSKFYSCCREYQDLVSRPLAFFQDPGTGMGVLLKQGILSFLKPAELSVGDGGMMELSLLTVEGEEEVVCVWCVDLVTKELCCLLCCCWCCLLLMFGVVDVWCCLLLMFGVVCC